MTRSVLGDNKSGLSLLCCIRAYVEIDILASFEVHTDVTIQQGRTAVANFVKLANVSYLFWTRNNTLSSLTYPDNQAYRQGDWNFPKMHLIQHLFDDIEAKGVT